MEQGWSGSASRSGNGMCWYKIGQYGSVLDVENEPESISWIQRYMVIGFCWYMISPCDGAIHDENGYDVCGCAGFQYGVDGDGQNISE